MIHQSNLHSKNVINRKQIGHDWPSASSTKFFQEIVVDEQRSLDLKFFELDVITWIKVTGCFFVDTLADFPLSNGTISQEICTPTVETSGPGGYDKSSEEAQEVVVKKEVKEEDPSVSRILLPPSTLMSLLLLIPNYTSSTLSSNNATVARALTDLWGHFCPWGWGAALARAGLSKSNPSPITKNRYRSKSRVSYLQHCHRISNI